MTNSKTLIIFLSVLTLFFSCNAQNKPKNITEQTTVSGEGTNVIFFGANTPLEIDKNILSIFQDKNNNYWFGTNGEGVYRYDPSASLRTDRKSITLFTEKDGLSNNQVQTIQEDKSGNIWFGTGGFTVSRFDGRNFTTFTTKESLQLNNTPDKEWKTEPDDLWFYAGGGAYHYNGNSFSYLPLPKTDFDTKYSQIPANRLGPYGVYSILKDKKGNLWFGTQTMGVCRYDPSTKSFTWFTEKGLSGPAVLGLFEDKNGDLWFGNNGYGLFRYDGKLLTNFTVEKGLSNDEFLKPLKVSGKAGLGTLARIYTINEDNNGNLWIGTIDAGVWRYDGKNLTNYTIKDGLPSNAVITIYKDHKGELWFGTETGVFKFNGVFFTKFTPK